MERWVVAELGHDYPWPGNMRELEQCVRNVLVHGEYRPRRVEPDLPDAADELAVRLRRGTLSADDLLQRYIEVVYAETKSLQETARLIGIDWRTVRAKLGVQREQNGEDERGLNRPGSPPPTEARGPEAEIGWPRRPRLVTPGGRTRGL